VASYLTDWHYKPADLTVTSDLHYFLYLRGSERPLLDVGCSVGNLLSIDPANSVGIEIDPKAVEICAQRDLSVRLVDLNEPLPFDDASFGTVHCRHVIEHVWEPLRLMREMERVLRPGGKLVLMTPDFRHAFRTFYDDHTHLRPLTRESLTRMALDAGFSEFTIQHEVSRIGLRQFVRRGKLSPAAGARLYRLAYLAGIRQRKTMLFVGHARR
jgi:SAM-dependent methyltransferase